MKILYITSGPIGDAVMASSVLAELVRRYPHAKISIVAGPLALPLFEALPQREASRPLIKQRHHRHWLALWWWAVRQKWDMVVDLRGSLISYSLWTKARITLPRPNPLETVPQTLAQCFSDRPSLLPGFWLAKEDKEAVLPSLNQLGGKGSYLALGLGASWEGKIWPVDRFVDLAQKLTAIQGPLAQYKIALVGDHKDRRLAEEFFRQWSQSSSPQQIINLCGVFSLMQTAALLANARLYIGNDSGLMYIAAAAGVPTLGLLGPTNEKRFHPYGPRGSFVRSRQSFQEITNASDYDVKRRDLCYMLGLTLEDAFDGAVTLIKRTSDFDK